jgi:UDP-glucose 4-epimerase
MGERYTHGVVFDFVKKLFADPKRLEILGDGSQKKSYLYVKDAIQGMVQVMEKKTARRGVAETYNLGNIDTLTAKEVAEIVCDELGLDSVIFSYTGGPRGWIGDSPYVLLDVRKLLRLGWSPSLSTEECVRITASYLANHLQLINRP